MNENRPGWQTRFQISDKPAAAPERSKLATAIRETRFEPDWRFETFLGGSERAIEPAERAHKASRARSNDA
jgi:hypothetical protein